jgi:hypothetical protein
MAMAAFNGSAIKKLSRSGFLACPQVVNPFLPVHLAELSYHAWRPSYASQTTHDQIRAQFPATSLGTVHKTLSLLDNMGEVLELGFSADDTVEWGS